MRNFVHKDGGMSFIRCHQVFSIEGVEKQLKTSLSRCRIVLNVYLEAQTDPGSELRCLNAPPTQVWLLFLQNPEWCKIRGGFIILTSETGLWPDVYFSTYYSTLRRQTPACFRSPAGAQQSQSFFCCFYPPQTTQIVLFLVLFCYCNWSAGFVCKINFQSIHFISNYCFEVNTWTYWIQCTSLKSTSVVCMDSRDC